MIQITLEEPLDNSFHGEEIAALQALEREMYIQGDSRSEIVRRVLDVLYMEKLINDVYVPNKMKREAETMEKASRKCVK